MNPVLPRSAPHSIPPMADCFVHASDLHLDAPLGSLGYLGEAQRKDLANRAGQAWEALVKLCIDEKASFCVLAGDIFHSAVAGVGVQLRFQEGLRRLDEAGVHVFICHGNHDPLSSDFQPVGELPPRVVRFEPGKPQSHQVELRDSGDPVQVSGVSFGERHEGENLALRFREIERLPKSAPHVAVLHANVGADPGHNRYALCSYDDLEAAPVDYWALGHIHKQAVKPLGNGRWAAYCGNLQGRSFKRSECEPKGALVVPIEHRRIGKPRFVACDQVRFERSEIAVSPADTIENIRAKIKDAARTLGRKHEKLPVAWELQLTGTNGEASRLREAISNRELIADLEGALSAGLNNGGLCEIKSSVRPPGDREAFRIADDLRAKVLTELDRLRATAESGDAATSELGKKLLGILPERGTQSEWRLALAERPEVMDEVVDLTEQLLLEAFDDGSAEVR